MTPALGIVAIGEEIPQSFAAPEPIAIKAGDGQHIWNVDLVNKGLRFTRQFRQESNSLGIDRGLRLVWIHGSGHPTDQVGLQVRVLPAQHRVDADVVPLKFQGLDVVGDGEQIRFGRQVVCRMTPIPAAEQAQLLALHQRLDTVLDALEVGSAGLRPG